MQSFPTAMTDTNIATNTNITMKKVTDFMVLFPKYAQDITCYENPMLNNLYLTYNARNYPAKSVSTIGQVFFSQQLDAGDFTLFNREMTDELEDSLTLPLADKDRRLNPTTDTTSFVWCVPVQRSSAGSCFDGLDSNGIAKPIALHGNAIYQGPLNTYYMPIPNNPHHPPAPNLVTVHLAFWVMNSSGRGQCRYETNRTLDEIVG
jgi:hypothetical protein